MIISDTKKGHPRYTRPSMNDSGNSVEFHFLMSEKRGSLPAAPHPVFSTRGSWAKRKDAVNNSEP